MVSAHRVRRYSMEHGVGYETHTHPVAYTTSEVAEVGHVPSKGMAKAVMLMAGDRLVMPVPGQDLIACRAIVGDSDTAPNRGPKPAWPKGRRTPSGIPSGSLAPVHMKAQHASSEQGT